MKSLLVILSLIMGVSLNAQKWYVDHNEEMQFWGNISIESLKKAPHGDWFNSNYEDYSPTKNVVVAESFKDVTVQVFMGTWCSDSHEWVPRFVKLWEVNGLPTSSIYLTGLHNGDDKYKQSPDGSEMIYGIERVPTFIFLRDGVEIGRITESPNNSLEEDVAFIAFENLQAPHF